MVAQLREDYRADPLDRTSPHTQELFERMGDGTLYHEAAKAGMSLSAFLEREDPTSRYQGETLDSFSRMLRCAEIRTQSIPSHGVYADKMEAFENGGDNARALVPEWVARRAREVKYGMSLSEQQQRLLYASSDFPPGSILRPYVDDAQVRVTQLMPAIPLAELVAVTTPIDSDAYRAFYLTDDPVQERMTRVTEMAEIPTAKLTGGTHTITLHKFGRALEVSYEQLRRQRIDMVALHIARMAIQAEVDKVAALMDIAINGDGNANTAATAYRLVADLGASTVGVLPLDVWLAFKFKFVNPYQITTAIVQDNVAIKLYMLSTGTANIPLVTIQAQSGFGSFTPINPGLADNVRLGHTTAAPANKILAFDKRWAIQRLTEIGSDITETERWISRQTQKLVMSEVEGYGVFDSHAVKILDLTQ